MITSFDRFPVDSDLYYHHMLAPWNISVGMILYPLIKWRNPNIIVWGDILASVGNHSDATLILVFTDQWCICDSIKSSFKLLYCTKQYQKGDIGIEYHLSPFIAWLTHHCFRIGDLEPNLPRNCQYTLLFRNMHEIEILSIHNRD